MTDIELRNKILDVIREDNYSLDSLKLLLRPAADYFGNKLFLDHIERLVKIIVTDRNGDKTFDIEDLKLLGQDVMAITSLITAIMLVLGSLPTVQLQYRPDTTEELVFKILVYVFVVVVPKETGKVWTLTEKEAVLDLVLLTYQMIRSSQVTKDIIAKVANYFKQKGWCSCICGSALPANEHAETVLEKQMPKVEWKLKGNVQNARDRAALHREIAQLRA